jgi:hypothetical protein
MLCRAFSSGSFNGNQPERLNDQKKSHGPKDVREAMTQEVKEQPPDALVSEDMVLHHFNMQRLSLVRFPARHQTHRNNTGPT